MIFDRDERIYWEDKVIAYLHDSPDKMFFIPGHEERAAELIESLGLQKPNFEKYRQADAIAAGFERGFLPPYSKDENKNGAVSMLVSPYLTHPISHTDPLLLRFPDDFPKTRDEKIAKASADTVNAALIEFMHKALEAEPVLSRTVDEPPYAKRLFFYLHLALRFRLSSENICGLGAFWHRIPADTRIPDHSIWQHNALTSALSSCSDIGKGLEDVALMSYSITPVQSYINSARRLRDFWTGSIILSWLAFEGIVWVMENLGPDHILYPSLIDQPLVRLYLT
ncbi:MAG TPA: type III-B CRISPR-associated protein Cas10/Cmr2, partial [Spirochaetia bacterium]|nr:type III-B CRISPR-associated protein Cas10/Cmr2 [Spirochaetia bacterium]